MAEAEAEASTEVNEPEGEREAFGSTLADALAGTCYVVYMLSINPCKCQVDEIESFKQHIQGVNAPEDLKPALSELAKRLDKVINDLKNENISLEDVRSLIEWCYLASESFIPQIVVEHALEIKTEEKPQGQG